MCGKGGHGENPSWAPALTFLQAAFVSASRLPPSPAIVSSHKELLIASGLRDLSSAGTSSQPAPGLTSPSTGDKQAPNTHPPFSRPTSEQPDLSSSVICPIRPQPSVQSTQNKNEPALIPPEETETECVPISSLSRLPPSHSLSHSLSIHLFLSPSLSALIPTSLLQFNSFIQIWHR